MNRGEIIEALAAATENTKADADRWLNAFIDVVSKNIKKKEGVRLVGFGTFATSKRKARTGRNPQTGEEIKIPARTVPVFKAGANLKAMVDNKKK